MHGREDRFRIIVRSPPLGPSYLTAHFVIIPRGSPVKHCNSTLAALPGEHLLLAPARHSARPALTSEFPPRPPTLTHVRLGGVDTRQLVAFTRPAEAGGILRPCATCSAGRERGSRELARRRDRVPPQ